MLTLAHHHFSDGAPLGPTFGLCLSPRLCQERSREEPVCHTLPFFLTRCRRFFPSLALFRTSPEEHALTLNLPKCLSPSSLVLSLFRTKVSLYNTRAHVLAMTYPTRNVLSHSWVGLHRRDRATIVLHELVLTTSRVGGGEWICIRLCASHTPKLRLLRANGKIRERAFRHPYLGTLRTFLP